MIDHWLKAFQVFIGEPEQLPLRFSYTLQPGKAPFSRRENIICLNAYPLLAALDATQLNPFLVALLDGIRSRFPLEFVEPHGFVLNDLQTALHEGHDLDEELFNGLILFGWCFQQYSARTHILWKKYPKGFEMARFELKGLYVRPGIVELRALQSFLTKPDEARSALTEIVNRLADEDFLYAPPRVPMWHSGDVSFNIRRLMTHAGFYTGEQLAWEHFSAWCAGYQAALSEGSLLLHGKAFWYSLGVLALLHQQTGVLPPYRSTPPNRRFYPALAGRRLLFVTSFHEAIRHLVASQKLRHLYHDIAMPDFVLETLPAFISTYPNRPHGHYRETFQCLVEQVERHISRSGTDLFMASCGCYGLPLCHYVYRHLGISAVYLGNSTNTLFGILQKTSLDFMRDHRNEANWIRGDLGQHYLNLDRIDQGRYL